MAIESSVHSLQTPVSPPELAAVPFNSISRMPTISSKPIYAIDTKPTAIKSNRFFAIKEKLVLPSIIIAAKIDDLDLLLSEIDNIDSGVSDLNSGIKNAIPSPFRSPALYHSKPLVEHQQIQVTTNIAII